MKFRRKLRRGQSTSCILTAFTVSVTYFYYSMLFNMCNMINFVQYLNIQIRVTIGYMLEDFVRTYFIKQEETLYRSRFRALLECLNDSELLNLIYYVNFELGIKSKPAESVNSYFLTRVESLPVTRLHKLIHGLIEDYKTESVYSRKYSFVIFLRELMFKLNDKDLAYECYSLFFESEYRSIRNNAYKLIDLDEGELLNFEKAFNKYHDKGAYQLLLKLKNRELKEKYFEDLFDHASGYDLWQLFKNIDLDDSRLEQLEDKDVITYVYVCAMRGLKIDDGKALRIWKKYSNDERKYILLSSFGKMKLWNVITEIH